MSEVNAQDLIIRLSAFRRRLRLRAGWLLIQRLSWISALGMVAILLAGRVVPVDRLGLWAFLGLPLFSLVFCLGYTWLRPISLMHAARKVDLELGLKERLSTALELSTAGEPASPIGLVQHQQADALSMSTSIDLHKAFPLPWLRRPTLAAAGLLVAALVLVWLPNPMDAILAERAAVEQVAQEQAGVVEALQKEIETGTTLDPELQAELLRQLAELAEKLRHNAGDREKALADLSQLEENLRRQIDPDAAQSQASLEAIQAQLQALAQMDDLDGRDLALSTEALQKLANKMEGMNSSQQADLANALSQLAAQAAQGGDSALSQALASLSQAAKSGDSAAASQASSQVSQALAQAAQQTGDQNALQQALNQLQSASQAMAGAGLSNPGMAGTQPGGQSGNNTGQGQSGRGMSGGGTRADQLPPATGSGQARRPGGVDTGSQTGDPADQLFVPWEQRSGEGTELTISGQDTGQGEIITRDNPNPSAGMPGPALIPYQQVFTQYQQAAQQAMDRLDIPPAYKDLVRDYFTLLEP